MLVNIVRKHYINKTCCSPKQQHTIIAKGDSGATSHYFCPQDTKVLSNIEEVDGPTVKQLDNTEITTGGTGNVPLSTHLSKAAQSAMILPTLKSASLISMGQLCDDGCKVVLDKSDLAVVNQNNVILRGKRNKTDGLWDIPITKQYITENNFQLPTTHAGMYDTNRYKPIEPNNGPRRSERKVIFPTKRMTERESTLLRTTNV